MYRNPETYFCCHKLDWANPNKSLVHWLRSNNLFSEGNRNIQATDGCPLWERSKQISGADGN